MSPAAIHDAAEKRFNELYDELRSRSLAINWHLAPDARQDAVQETFCHAWAWLLAAAKKDRLNKLTAFSIVRYAALAYRSGRRFAGSSSKDVMGERAHANGEVKRHSIDDLEIAAVTGSPQSRLAAAALTDSRTAQPQEIARVDMDYELVPKQPGLSQRAAQVFNGVLLDNQDGHVKRIAGELGVTSARISQCKRELQAALSAIDYAPAGRRRRPGPCRAA